MMNYLVMQSNAWQAVHEEFQKGGSYWEVFWTLLLLTTALAGLVLFQRVQQRRAGGPVVQNPGKLFRVVTSHLHLGVLQRDLLYRMARELKLEHPTVLLLSPVIFSDHTRRWLDLHQEPPSGGGPSAHTTPASPDSLNDLCHAIFGSRIATAGRNPDQLRRTSGPGR